MESDSSEGKISTLLTKISSYPKKPNPNPKADTSSNNSDAQNSKKLKEPTADEKYFYFKLKMLLCVPKEFSFLNVNVELKNSLKTLKAF